MKRIALSLLAIIVLVGFGTAVVAAEKAPFKVAFIHKHSLICRASAHRSSPCLKAPVPGPFDLPTPPYVLSIRFTFKHIYDMIRMRPT